MNPRSKTKTKARSSFSSIQVFAIAFTTCSLLLGLFAASAFAQDETTKPAAIKPIADPSINADPAESTRVKAIGVKSLKAVMRVFLKKERRKLFNRNERRIEAIEVLLEDDELLEIWISDRSIEFQKSLGSSAKELGDGVLLERWLEWLGSDGFKDFIDTLMPAIERLIDIIGGLADNVHSFEDLANELDRIDQAYDELKQVVFERLAV